MADVDGKGLIINVTANERSSSSSVLELCRLFFFFLSKFKSVSFLYPCYQLFLQANRKGCIFFLVLIGSISAEPLFQKIKK